MNLAIFGATGSLGGECVTQALEAGHDVRVLVRDAERLPAAVRDRVTVIEGDALDPKCVELALAGGPEAVLFAIGVDAGSPEDLCTDVTRHVLEAMLRLGVRRLVWCGGGSTRVPEDVSSFGAKFVELFASTFMGLRHRDKAHQYALLEQRKDVEWVGVRPLQMRSGPKRGVYRVGFDRYGGLSKIHFADCADAMLGLVQGERWLHQAPILQY